MSVHTTASAARFTAIPVSAAQRLRLASQVVYIPLVQITSYQQFKSTCTSVFKIGIFGAHLPRPAPAPASESVLALVLQVLLVVLALALVLVLGSELRRLSLLRAQISASSDSSTRPASSLNQEICPAS